MALPFPIDLSKTIDDIIGPTDASLLLASRSSQVPRDFMPGAFDICFVGFRDQSTSVARYAEAEAMAAASGERVFEYNVFSNKERKYGFFGLTVAKDDEALRDRLSVFLVMGS